MVIKKREKREISQESASYKGLYRETGSTENGILLIEHIIQAPRLPIIAIGFNINSCGFSGTWL